jgi:predicted NACHT family NTPase
LASRVQTKGTSHHQSLLILGDRGAGKTVFLYRLLRWLLTHAERTASRPIPIVFNLAAWPGTRQGLADWMLDTIHQTYQVPVGIARGWLGHGQVLPLFDRLDEIPGGRLDAHIAALNALQEDYPLPGIAVCARSDAYHAASRQLRLDGAVTLQPITPDRIDALLHTAAFEQLARLAAAEPQLGSFLRNRLALTLAYRIQHDLQHADIRAMQGNGDAMQNLLDLYIERLYRRYPARRWDEPHTRTWLSWLARYMRDNGVSILRPLWIQPAILPSRIQRKAVTIGAAVLVAALLVLLAIPSDCSLPRCPASGSTTSSLIPSWSPCS